MNVKRRSLNKYDLFISMKNEGKQLKYMRNSGIYVLLIIVHVVAPIFSVFRCRFFDKLHFSLFLIIVYQKKDEYIVLVDTYILKRRTILY